MRAIQKGKKMFLMRISIALLILAICGGSVSTGYPAYADDGGDAVTPAVDVNAPVIDISTPTDTSVPASDAEAPAVDAAAVEADASTPDVETLDTVVDTGAPVADAEVAVDDVTETEVDDTTPVSDLETPADNASAPIDDTHVADATVGDTAVSDAQASAATGQADYMPGDTVDISGDGFAANAEVTVTLTKPDGSETQWIVDADDSGQITTNYELTDGFKGAYFVSLSDGDNTGATLFTDPVTVLIPNGNGAATQLSDYPSAGSNWQKVDDGTPDGDTTYVYTNNTSTSGRRDLYAIGNLTDTVKPDNPVLSSTTHTPNVWSNNPVVTMVWNGVSDPGSPSANSVTVKAICKTSAAAPGGSASVGVRPQGGTTEWWSAAGTLGTDYGQFSSQWDTNPRTGQPWTYTDVNNLQAGVRLKSSSSSTQARSTMVWLEVDSDAALASGVYRYYYEWNDSTPNNWMANQGTGVQHSVTQTLAQGTRTFYVYARDNANNNSSTISSGPYLIDLTNPNISTSRTPAPNGNGWNRTDVTASYTASDALSGLVTPPSGSYVFTTEGQSQSHDFTATDRAGNTNSATVTVNIDKTNPTVSGSPNPGANSNGWNNTNVVVHFTGNDTLSGIATVTPDVTISSEGINRSASGTATDRAGNSASTTVSGINIDKTDPTINGSRTPGANANGWNNNDVTVSFTASDMLSGVDTLTPNTTLSSDGAGQSVTGTATDKASNSASTTVSGINIDKTDPTISGSVSPGATPYGWHNTDVTVDFTAEDNLSGIDTVTPDATLSLEGAGQSASGTATDRAGNSASTTVSGINIDKTDPTISGSRTPGANAHGWNNSDVTVSFTANDALAGIDTVTPDTTLSSDGAGQSASGTATDRAGNFASTTVGGINIDKTNPALTDELSRTGMDEITVTLTGNDALSGVDFIRYSTDGGGTWTTVYSPTTTFTISGAGEYNLSNLVFDIAGNEYMMDRAFSIEEPVAGEIASNQTLVIDVMGTVAAYPVTPDGRLLADVKVASPDNALMLDIPSGGQVLNEDGSPASQVQIMASETANVPAGYQIISAYQFVPAGIIFSQEATLTMNYAQEKMPENSAVVMAFYDEATGKWAGLENSGQVAELEVTDVVTSHISGAGTFAVLAKVQ